MHHISIEKRIADFENHLVCNSRIIFSAKFGDGKTYFLRQYMARHQIWKDYTPEEERVGSDEDSYFIVLHPVNYVVAQNEDIFEYIKRDILNQLYGEGRIDSIDYSSVLKAIGETANEKILPVIYSLISVLPKGELINSLIKLGKDVYDKYQGINQNVPDYLKSFEDQKGGIYEHDAYTEIIEKTLQFVNKPSDGEKARTVLIVEDLDRLDPAHLFRILNVLGAHVDLEEDKNKFGFDNIVLVLDYEVTKSIFHHFYGEKANYAGYMNKYMSCYPFDFSITREAHDTLRAYLSDECGLGEHLNIQLYSYSDLQESPKAILSSVIDSLSVRDIVKIMDDIDSQYRNELVQMNGYTFSSVVPFTKLLSVLTRLHVAFNYNNLVKLFSRDAESVKALGAFVLAENQLEQMRFTMEDRTMAFRVDGNLGGDVKSVNLVIANDHYASGFSEGRSDSLQAVILKAILTAKEYVMDAPLYLYD